MKRILVICIIIVAVIVVGDIFLQKYVNNTFDVMSGKLEKIGQYIEDKQACTNIINEIDNIWENNFDRMACYIEHDELEKVKTQIVIIKAGIEMDDSEYVYEEVSRAIYIINHIKQKESLKIDNIF